jgi:vacuolar-type H+-ATPase subunit E/Vma4
VAKARKFDLEAAVQALDVFRSVRAKLEAKLAVIRAQEQDVDDAVRIAMLERKIESVATKKTTYALKRTLIAALSDDKKFFTYVAKTRQFDLLRRQPALEACRERWDHGKKIPGVEQETRVSLSATARKGNTRKL